MPASLALRPTLIAVTIGASVVGSSLVGIENGFGSLWLSSNASLHLLIAAWLLSRPGAATAGALSAGVLSAFVLVIYGSWAPALAVTVPGTGAAVPLWAEVDANFGVIGLLAFGAILGRDVSRSDTADRRRMESVATAATTGAVLASVLSRSLMFFALYEFAAIVLQIWTISRWRPGARLR